MKLVKVIFHGFYSVTLKYGINGGKFIILKKHKKM